MARRDPLEYENHTFALEVVMRQNALLPLGRCWACALRDGVFPTTQVAAMYANFDGMSDTVTLSARSAGTTQYSRLLPAWFRCFLADDATACAMFKGGEECPVCKESGWEQIFSKNY